MAKTVFVNGDPEQQIEGTIVDADFLNAINDHVHDGADADGSADPIDLTAHVSGILPSDNGGAWDYMLAIDEKAQGTYGGDSTAGVNTRNITDLKVNDVGANLNSNQLTLPAGTYRCRISCPANSCNRHSAYLYNVTDANIAVQGSSENANNQGENIVQTRSLIIGQFTIAGNKVFEIRHYIESPAGGTNTADLGDPTNVSGMTEIYTIAEFWKKR